MSPTICSVSGQSVHLVAPDPGSIHIADIAHSLAHLCRFTGHTRQHYSVAQHSVLLSFVVKPEHALAGLLHDAAEAYLGDVSSPLKSLLPEYRLIEQRMQATIHRRFGLPQNLPEAMRRDIKHADAVMLATECRDLMPGHGQVWSVTDAIKPLPVHLYPWAATLARLTFLQRYEWLRACQVEAAAAADAAEVAGAQP